MNEVRKFRKGDKLEANKGFIYEVVGNETESGTVRAKLIEQPALVGQMRYSTNEQKLYASSLRRWTLLEEGPAKRPNNRVTKVSVSDIRLGDKIRHMGQEFVVERMEGRSGVWSLFNAGKTTQVIVNGTETVEVLGARGRKMSKTVHFNRFTEPGLVIVQRASRPGFGSFACGIVANIDIFASSPELVTCEQRCNEECQDHARRKANRK